LHGVGQTGQVGVACVGDVSRDFGDIGVGSLHAAPEVGFDLDDNLSSVCAGFLEEDGEIGPVGAHGAERGDLGQLVACCVASRGGIRRYDLVVVVDGGVDRER